MACFAFGYLYRCCGALLTLVNTNSIGFPSATPATIHVRISNTETWDYPAEWGVQRIRDELQKRLAVEDEKDREWAAHVPAPRKAECHAIPPTTPFTDQPADCVRLFFAETGDLRAVPTGWEARFVKAPVCKNGLSSCEPWERDWGTLNLMVGFVVTEEGIIINPNQASVWRIIAAATPWAFAPPLVVLALVHRFFGYLQDLNVTLTKERAFALPPRGCQKPFF